LFCPDCVKGADWRTLPDVTGKNNPRLNGGKVKRDCDVGGTAVDRYPSDFTGEACLCSERCRRTWLSEAFSGEGHPNWKGGSNRSYGKGWSRLRATALKRDGYRCRLCGETRSEIGRNPDVHHFVPVRRFAEADDLDVKDAHRIDNVVSPCVECHLRADFGKVPAEALREPIE
jgi:5-methylcytosine-specific restriction endonuclease McrA